MNYKTPLISIIIPIFNRADLIGETLDSVRAQTYMHWECIVIDDNSSDYILELMEFYTEKDSRIQFHKRPARKNKGAASCRNYGLGIAMGEYVQFLDSDDILHSMKLEQQIGAIKGKLEQTVLTCKWGYFSANSDYFSKLKRKQKVYRNFKNPIRLLYYFGKNKEFLPIHSYLIPSEVIKKSGLWNEQLANNDDAEFMTRVLINTREIKFVPDAYVFYRAEGQNLLSGFKTKKNVESAICSLKLIQKHLEKNYPRTSKKYVSQSKSHIILKIENNFPNLLQEYADFLNP